ncbi:aromatic ring-hydroxylating oxygenase subunit alpha [Gloeobacter kilaueensis]|uniref:Rieske (2Fe-2S) domain protein n=1 Tax=Gloeobacter kilaueensis (strain ATCC BAA-2537 / CCAP 1431/1 / ULC 316 / JS1) TaxID=1183438 RepID=U5QN24_GLOK1|nr:aromatic ring-hydroxylating dioxygenase subunit alpha [Gloeobacter kilaueensis]AGY59004.1 Rieske (2Fe-2S) domain protein [Gloeobacter kilaueensis JS1]
MNDIRRLPINPDHWYAVAQSHELAHKPLAVTLWDRAIVLFRSQSGTVHALEDRCPHRQVRLSGGRIFKDELECAYHGWRFDSQGICTYAPYQQGVPRGCRVRSYPACEGDGFVWIFAGDPAQAHSRLPLAIPEWSHLNYIATVSLIDCRAHFSYLIENLMDMHHGHLHENFQAWGEAQLESLSEQPEQIDATYTAESYYRIDRIWSVAQLFIPALRQPHPETLKVSYIYPHWRSSLGADFRIYCLICPTGLRTTRAYLVHFTSLEAFDHLHKLPVPFRRLVKDSFFGSAQSLLDGLVRQDVEMIEQEQRAYDHSPSQKNWEPNRALAAVQRLIRAQSRAGQSAL